LDLSVKVWALDLNAEGSKVHLQQMQQLDLNLLVALDALLDKGSVTGAAEKLGLSVPAMSRTLVRIRKLMRDPIMVQAGRGLVPTPRALEIRARVSALVRESRDVISLPAQSLADAERTVTIRAEESYVAVYAAEIADEVHKDAPRLSLRFTSQGEEAVGPLREGIVDLDIGNIKLRGPEVKLQKLFESRFVGVVRSGHPLAGSKITAKGYVEWGHVGASRRGLASGPIDDALGRLGLKRNVSLVVPTFMSALMIVASSDLVGAVPDHLTHSAAALYGLHVFPLPVRTEANRISVAWHPRFDFDPVHRLVRDVLVRVCTVKRTGPARP
jgi:DNA-binding transcriptional LysR family regulator